MIDDQKLRRARVRALRASTRRKVRRQMERERLQQIAAIRIMRFIAGLAGFSIIAYRGEDSEQA